MRGRLVGYPARFFQRWNIQLFWLFCLFALARVVANACVFDDAYITFRVVDNFTNGYGLRWNIDERVQVFTHPLWMLLHIPLHLLTNNFYIASIILSMLCGALGVWLLATMVEATRWHIAALVIVPLLLSRIFNSYINCGLENPLSFLLLIWFAREWLRPNYRLDKLCFITSLCALARFDNSVLVMPALAYGLWERRLEIRLKPLLSSASPLLIWCTFSLFYYGFIMPNTKYAKTDTGIPFSYMVVQGLKYVFNLFYYDTLSFLLIAGGIYNVIKYLLAICRGKDSGNILDRRLALLGAGIALNLIYIVAVGGDYMCGRFFTGMFAFALAMLLQLFHRCRTKVLLTIVAALLVVKVADEVIITPLAPSVYNYREDFGINDHHSLYYNINGLFSDTDHWFRTAVSYKVTPPEFDADKLRKVSVNGFVGYEGFFVPRDLIIIDYHALADPLLARLPVKDIENWRVGHFNRTIPKGYLLARQNDDTSQMDPSLALYYQKLRLVTSGDLFDPERLESIIGFQLGIYDHWRDEYLERIKH